MIRTIVRSMLAAALGAAALAAAPAAAGPAWYAAAGGAIAGTDPVAYFIEGRPVPGKPGIAHAWMGVTWHFARAANRDAFAADPARYAPQYGGFCAWAVSQGYTAKIDPEAWTIVDGKLYLNYSTSIRSRWSLDRKANIVKADGNWPDLKKELEAK